MYVPSEENVADMFTKPLSKSKLLKFSVMTKWPVCRGVLEWQTCHCKCGKHYYLSYVNINLSQKICVQEL